MRPFKCTVLFVGVSAAALGSAMAQNASNETPSIIVDVTTQGPDDTPAFNPDESADLLNSRQQLQQTFTLRRTINGEVVETEQRTVIFDPNRPYRETEASQTTVERLKAAFDGEVLTRIEALEEAKIDFTIADINRDNAMDVTEFSELVASWRETDMRTVDAPNEKIARQREYDAFLAEISPETAKLQQDTNAKEKFLFLTGGAEQVTRKDYIREYLLDFDSMDEDNDTILQGNELLRFRALSRGETLDMPPL
jgi:hypothetical protein